MNKQKRGIKYVFPLSKDARLQLAVYLRDGKTPRVVKVRVSKDGESERTIKEWR